MGVPYSQKQALDGIDIWPLIEGARSNRGAEIYFQFGKQSAVVADNFKLYRRDGDRAWELYQIARDVAESTDVASAHPEVVARMKSGFESWARDL